ncbi:MAG TPA: BTAD domain-containing putative transcriptional regulator [Kofleriaceae bacterium]|jgi:predicted ATPase/DNA-binding SARP family transcriptional activator|nr:BTAD domain-containing putative transcriptional regulator [Kofleriaceae bacterium]
MPVVLELLREVRWRGAVVVGERPQALLAALAAEGCRAVSSGRLIELVWGEEGPANGAKGLQVLVSRTRGACGADAILTDGSGYRLGLDPRQVDSIRLAQLVREAGAALERDAAAAAALAQSALALVDGGPSPAATDGNGRNGGDPLRDLRSAAAEQLAGARVILARALSRTGGHAEALPGLEHAWRADDSDESLLADLLRSQAAVHGPAAALERYEQYRRELRARLGVNPGERLRSLQRELLALDQPVRSGLRYDPTALVGRERDLERLRGLMRGSRVVSIVGPGGLGKTRLAHVLARDAGLPVSHVVELVGVSSGEDVVAEIGAVLGVRDSVSSRRVLTAAQRSDVRGRIAQQLAQAPGLLVLDNCEHVVGSVAELVAFLVSVTPALRVLTTSRAPLAIAAEHVYLLDQLELGAGIELFRARANSARPLAELDDQVVGDIVTRLDGLPLAIELAAAKVRVMSVQDIDRRLGDRFALLRGGDRSAPDRHQTLLAVIDWSWNLLDDAERRALRRLSLFHDGFTLEAAGTMLGADALEPVQGLVDQSLLKLQERAGEVRYRMLETVREFGRLQLAATGEEAAAATALRSWALGYAGRHGVGLGGAGQLAAIDALAAEDVNLTDELRAAIAQDDRESLVRLLAAVGALWSIRGEHARLIMLAEAAGAALTGWDPPADCEQATRLTLALLLSNTVITQVEFQPGLRDLLRTLGPGDEPRLAGMVRVMLAYDPDRLADFRASLEQLAVATERQTARSALQWLSHIQEHSGETEAAAGSVEAALALIDESDGPWEAAILQTQLSQLLMQLGRREQGRASAEAAVPVMARVGARDDELQLHALLALCAVSDERLEDAERELAEVDRIDPDQTVFAGAAFRLIGRAELAIARGQHAAALRDFRECAAYMRELRFPGVSYTGTEPWALFGDAAALTAHAYYAAGEDQAHGAELLGIVRGDVAHVLTVTDSFVDLPVVGLELFAVGVWGLTRGAFAAELAVQLLALADRFAYVRTGPTLAWERIVPLAEQAQPGSLERLGDRYRARELDDLRNLARELVAQIPG